MHPATRSCAWAALAALASGLVIAAAPETAPYTREVAAGGDYSITTHFLNFNRDPLTLFFPLPRDAVKQSLAEFGYEVTDQSDLMKACDACSQEEFDKKVSDHYRERGLVPNAEGPGRFHLFVDMPAEVARNRKRMHAIAVQLDEIAEAHHYGSEQTVGAIVAMVQTALLYKPPPEREGGREILGFYPPPRALEAGFGDCDTKSALLAAVLANFPGVRMIGVHIPNHYLVGIARVPREGDAFIEFNGEPYVLIEASGPHWRPPGLIGDATQAALQTMTGLRIDALF
jgi:hypothetical protein